MSHDNGNESGNCIIVGAIILAVLVLLCIVLTQGRSGEAGLYNLFRSLFGV